MTKRAAKNQVTPGQGAGLPLLVLLGLLLAIGAGLYSSHMMRPAGLAGAPQAAVMRPGAALEVVAEVAAAAPDGRVVAALLERRGDGYRQTGRTLQVSIGPATKFVMGGRDALKPGAVLQLHGVADGRGLEADQVVFLTGYVKVE